MKRWSRESMQVPPTSPVTQLSGSGLGKNGSTTNLGMSDPERSAFRRDRLPQARGDRQCCHHHGDVEIASALHDALLVRPVFAANSYVRIVGQDQSTEGYDRRGA